MVNPESSSSSKKMKALKSLLPLFNKISNNNMARSLYIYLKLFILIPIKYLILVYLFIIIYYLLIEAYKYGILAYKNIIGFFQLLAICALAKKCKNNSKNYNPMFDKKCCELNLIIFSVPDVFKLFMGVLEFILGFIYLLITLALIIASAICLIPFSFILPHYTAII